jgi:hypothetical protein
LGRGAASPVGEPAWVAEAGWLGRGVWAGACSVLSFLPPPHFGALAGAFAAPPGASDAAETGRHAPQAAGSGLLTPRSRLTLSLPSFGCAGATWAAARDLWAFPPTSTRALPTVRISRMIHPESALGWGRAGRLRDERITSTELYGFCYLLSIVTLGVVVGVATAHYFDEHTPWETGLEVGLGLGVLMLVCVSPGSPSG